MFLDMTLRSLWRHKTRSFLTGLGIILAIAAIVSLGSISEGIDSLVQQQLKFASNTISVSEKEAGTFTAGPPGMSSKIPREVADEISQMEGVSTVSPQIRAISIENQLFIVGFPLKDTEHFNLQNIDFIEGGWPDENEKALVIGYQLAETKKLGIGDGISVNGDKYTISGILEEMRSFMDYAALTSLESAADTFDMQDYYSMIVVDPADVSDAKRIANEIDETYDDLDAVTTDEALRRAEATIGQVRMITLGIGIVASIVASIGIINTMIVVVLERRQEFGIMKALGAKRSVILSIVLQEAVIIGIIGSVIGILIGYAGTEGINKASSFPIASVTPTLSILSLAYGIMLSVIAALYPSYNAINVDPAQSMREE